MTSMGVMGAFLTGGEQGARREFMKEAGLAPGQIDTIEQLSKRYPALQNLEMRDLLSKPEFRAGKESVLTMLGNEETANKFGEALQKDPSLVQRVNTIFKTQPEKVPSIVAQIQQKPDNIAQTLAGSVSNEQVAQFQAQQAQEAQQNPLAGFTRMFEGLGSGGGFSMEGIGKILLGIVNLMYGLVEKICTGIGNFAKSNEIVAAGNGINNPKGPLQQFAALTGNNPTTHVQGPDGQVASARLTQHAAPSTAPATPQPAPEQQQRPVAPVS